MSQWQAQRVKDWKPYISHRCLVVEHQWSPFYSEVLIKEVSPKGKVKVEFESGAAIWADRYDYLLLEDLGEKNDTRRAVSSR